MKSYPSNAVSVWLTFASPVNVGKRSTSSTRAEVCLPTISEIQGTRTSIGTRTWFSKFDILHHWPCSEHVQMSAAVLHTGRGGLEALPPRPQP